MPFDPSKITLEADDNAFIHWYDARCKRILSNKMVLAHILSATMDEFAGIEPEIIATRYIEGIPGKENKTPKIQGLRNERNDNHRNASFFDVIFYALIPDTDQSIPIIINVESQEDYSPGYDLRNRGIFYIGCMIADQKDSVFEKDNFDNLRKVCSIWICPDPPKSLANTISTYTLQQRNILGDCPIHPVDKIQLILIHLGSEEDNNYTGVMPLLDVCLTRNVDSKRQREVTEQYRVKLESEDYIMTAGEQIIYKHKREMWELEEKAKELEEKTKGLEEKAKKDKDTTVKALKEANVPIEIIAKSTGFSVEEVNAL